MNRERKDKLNEVFSIHKSVNEITPLISLIVKTKTNTKNNDIINNKKTEFKRISKIIFFG